MVVVGLNGYPMRLQVIMHEGQSFADKIVDIERSPGPPIPFEERPNILDQRAGTVPAGHDSLLCGFGLIEVGRRAIKPAQAGIGGHNDRRQWLLDLVSH